MALHLYFTPKRCVLNQATHAGSESARIKSAQIYREVGFSADMQVGATHKHRYGHSVSTVKYSTPAVLNKANSPQLWTVNRAEHYL